MRQTFSRAKSLQMKDEYLDSVLSGSTESYCSFFKLNGSSARNSQASIFNLLVTRIRKRKLSDQLMFEEEQVH